MPPIFSSLHPKRSSGSSPLSDRNRSRSSSCVAGTPQQQTPCILASFARTLSSQFKNNPLAQKFVNYLAMAHESNRPPTPPASWVPVDMSSWPSSIALPYTIDSYDLTEPVAGDVDFFHAVHKTSGERFLCKVLPHEGSRMANLFTAHSRLNSLASINPIAKVLTKSFPRENSEDAGAGGTSSDFVVNFLFYRTTVPRLPLNLQVYVSVKNRLSETEARKWFWQLCEMVHACHHSGVALRDLKVRRFGWNSNGELMLLNLDHCVLLESEEADMESSENQPSPDTVSPELRLRREQNEWLRKRDIWGLGLVLYAMLIGQYPFFHPNPRVLAIKIKAALLGPLPVWLSDEVKHLLRVLLHVNPRGRPDVHLILQHCWWRKDLSGIQAIHNQTSVQATNRSHNMVADDSRTVPEE